MKDFNYLTEMLSKCKKYKTLYLLAVDRTTYKDYKTATFYDSNSESLQENLLKENSKGLYFDKKSYNRIYLNMFE